jgi:predicted DNA-binding transcriptional regulator YafY
MIFQIEVYDTPELVTILLKNGANLKVISPVSLISRLKDEFKKAADLYS